MVKICDIDTILIDSPGRKWTIVRVFTDAGLVGLGEATYSNKEPVVAHAIDYLKPVLVGADPARIEYLWHKLYGAIWRMSGPVWMSAISGIDLALWDIKGKVANLPVFELLGGKFRDRVEVYTHFKAETPEESARQARHWVDRGFKGLKTGARQGGAGQSSQYMGNCDPQATAAHFAAVRAEVGADVKLLVDCHGRFSVANCIRLGRALEPYDLYVLEDPVPPDDLSAYPKVRREVAIPIMGSERLNTKSQYRQLLDLDGVDVAQPDLMYAGGITEVRKIATFADIFQVPISMHNTKGPVGILAAAHLMGSIPNVAPMEFVTGIDWRDEILTEPLRVEDGCVVLPEAPGFGVELDMGGVEKHRWRG